MTAAYDIVCALRLPHGVRVAEGFAKDGWIRTILEAVFAKDNNGLPRYRMVYVELPRGHWKSGGSAGVATGEALTHDDCDVVVLAADREQAAIILENIQGYLARDPELRQAFEVNRDEIKVRGSRSRIRVMSSDVASLYGLGGTHQRFRVIADELTSWKDEALFTAIVSATGKVPDSQVLVLSNAGFDQERSWQWRIRSFAKDHGFLYSSKGPIASWIDDAWIEQQRLLLPPAAFARLIQNVWSSTVGDFVTVQQWSACIDALWKRQAGGAGHFVAGLDLGLSKDRTALAICHRDEGIVALDSLEVWEGSRDDPVSIEQIERALTDAHERFRSLKIFCDPWQFKGSVERLRARGLNINEFSFGERSVSRLSQTLYSAIASGRLRVYDDAELTAEILGLQVKQSNFGWRFDHASGGFSDRAVALGLCLMELTEDFTSPAASGFKTLVHQMPTITRDPEAPAWMKDPFSKLSKLAGRESERRSRW